MNTPITVSALNEKIKSVIDTTFSSVYVEGEISNLTHHNSGHIYFSIKDKKSTISCVMFRGNAQYLKFRLEVGQKINISGNITVYAPRGNYQLIAQKIEPSGIGALALAYEQLKTKLQIKGYFDNTIKKELPQYPNKIYIVTSKTGAAIEDMKKILAVRYPLAKMVLLPTLVQGENAKYNIVENIQKVDILSKNEDNSILIVGRGGGSIEDLWAFNEEIVADAIFEVSIPIISAVGHESDFVISDFVADIRASTPSNAIEISTPNIDDLRLYLDSINNELSQRFKIILSSKEQSLSYLKSSFEQHSLKRKFDLVEQTIIQLKQQYNNSFTHKLKVEQSNINMIQNSFEINHPSKKDKNGYVQLTSNDKIADINTLEENDIVSLQSSTTIVKCKVISKLIIDKIS